MKSKIFLLVAIVVLFSGCPEDEQSSETSRKNAGTMLDAAHRLITYADSHPLDKAMECEGLPLGQNVMHINVKVMGLCPLNMPEQELINVHLYKVASTGCWGAYVTYNFVSAMTCIPTKALSGFYCIRSKFCMKPSNILAYALGAWAQQALDQIYWYLVIDQILDVPTPAPTPTPQIIDGVTKENRDNISLLLGGIAAAVLYLYASEYMFANAINSLDPAATLNLWSAGMIQNEWQTKETRIDVLATANEIESAMSQVDSLAPGIIPVDSSPPVQVKWSPPVMTASVGTVYQNSMVLSITMPSSDLTLKFTDDGADPSRWYGYESHVQPTLWLVLQTITFKAMVYGGANADSDVSTLTVVVGSSAGGTVATPTFSPNGGTFTSSQTWYVNCSTSGATIMVTCDGSTPSPSNGVVYSGGMQSFGTTIAKAMAYKSGMTNSSVATATFTQVSQPPSQVADPIIFPGGGTFSTSVIWSVSTSTSGATIRITTDGSTPSPTNGWIYTGPLQSYGTTTAKAIAYKSGMTSSNVVTVTFTKQ